jgi:pyrimidine-nucleoside phosphorylase
MLSSGSAWETFRRFVANQGGDIAMIDDPEQLPRAPVIMPLPAQRAGTVAAIDGMALGYTLNDLGGGRARKEDRIDPAVGLVLAAKVGDRVAAGEPLLHVHAASDDAAARVLPRLAAAYTIGDTGVAPPPLIYEIIR